jgi:hypothetical protein
LRTFGLRTSDLGPRQAAALVALALLIACGKKGPPLAPLSMAPEPPRNITARRLGDTVYLTMTVPDKNTIGRGPYSVDHIDVYAVTIGPGMVTPPNRDLLKPEHVIAHIPVQPPPDPDAPEPATTDARPLPGEVATFVEKLTGDTLVPQVITKPPPPEKARKPSSKAAAESAGATASPAGAPPTAPAAPVGPEILTRMYVLMGVPKNGKGTMPSARVSVPLLQAPGAPRPGTPSADETSVTVAWEPPPSTTDEAPGVLYNVYAVPADGAAKPEAPAARPAPPVPLNDKPLAEQRFVHAGAAVGTEQCFVVRSVAAAGNALIESDPSRPMCITPKDTFPPAAPKGLAAVASEGVINLIWDASGEPDLAGYLILRGEAPGATLQPLVRDPIKETRYADRTTRANVRYVYAIVAVDKAGNRSVPSNRVEEAAR